MEQNLTNAARQDEQILQMLPKAKESAETEDEILSHAFLAIEEVATLLRGSKRTVYDLIYKGVLLATKVTYHVTVISKQDFFDMLERNRYVGTVAFPKTMGAAEIRTGRNLCRDGLQLKLGRVVIQTRTCRSSSYNVSQFLLPPCAVKIT